MGLLANIVSNGESRDLAFELTPGATWSLIKLNPWVSLGFFVNIMAVDCCSFNSTFSMLWYGMLYT